MREHVSVYQRLCRGHSLTWLLDAWPVAGPAGSGPAILLGSWQMPHFN